MNRKSPYSPSGNVKDSRRTYVPDMYRQAAEEILNEDQGSHSSGASQGRGAITQRMIKLQPRQIVGVLYSISAGIMGEIFPLYIGRNIFGSHASCDIILNEATVSPRHGIILARKQPDDDGNEFINLIISDTDSESGTLLNGERLFSEKRICKSGDLVTVGNNYQLLVTLFDAIGRLAVSGNPELFKRAEPEEEQIVAPSLKENMEAGKEGTGLNEKKSDAPEFTNPSLDFYKPTKQKEQDHFNSNTIIL